MRMTYTKPAAHRAIARILDLLAHRPATTPEVAKHMPADIKHAQRYLRWLRDQGAIHIGTWTREPVLGQRAYPREVWVDGPGKDAPRPPRKTGAEIARDTRRKAKAEDPVGYSVRRRLKALAKRAPKRDVAASWIGGQA